MATEPRWQKELYSFKGIKSVFIIEGNINDKYPLKKDDDVSFVKMEKAIIDIFSEGETKDKYDFLLADPLFGFTEPSVTNGTEVKDIVKFCEDELTNQEESRKQLNGKNRRSAHSDNKLIGISEVSRIAMTTPIKSENKRSVAIIMNFASHFVSSPNSLSFDEITFFLNLLYSSKNAIRGNEYINTLILIVDNHNGIPTWLYANNPGVRMITIPTPERAIRQEFISKYFPFSEITDEAKRESVLTKLTDLTDGMKLLEIDELRRLYKKLKCAPDADMQRDPVKSVVDLVSIYRYGFKDNPWEEVREKIANNCKQLIEKRVKGQENAVNKIVCVLKRAVSGLSGIMHSAGARKPRGILFLVGPTGTGKTEIVKTITEMLFGDEKMMIRFDMSEYTAEHSDQKLFGAPPGYVGYENGGQLTNAVKNNPFSVLLFDEIEKAHPNIMDKFLQILEDGRLTDGQGNTVSFSETLIFFTSNAGMSREIIDPTSGRVIDREVLVHPDEPYDQIQQKVEDALRVYFKPEVLNRIGDNVVVFNYISQEASQNIVRAKVNTINDNIFETKRITVTVDDRAYTKLFDLCSDEKTRLNGGRGIGNVMEEKYLNPLSEYMFDADCRKDDTVLISANADELIFTKK